MDINGCYYLIYYIPAKKDKRYMASVIYDIQKENNYKNFIILVDDIKSIKIDELCFGKNQVLILENNECNRERLKYLHSINWPKIVKDYFDNKIVLSEYCFCDYTDHKNKYISTFYFLDSEKINRIKHFLRENKNRRADIICSAELKEILINEFPKAQFIVVDFDKYIDKVRKYYY